MAFSLAQYSYGLVATASSDGVNCSLSGPIGTPTSSTTYDVAPDVIYSLAMFITDGDNLTLNLATGAVTGTVTGTSQVETATVVAASGVTSNGTCNVVFTAAAVTGSPLTIPVTLTTAQTTATLIAVEIRAALTANVAIAAEYTIGGTGATVTATRINKRQNDGTLNIAIPAGLGITAAASSTNTTAGVGESKAYRINGMAWNQTDHEGKTLATATKLYSILIKSDTPAGSVDITGPGTSLISPTAPFVDLQISKNGDHLWSAGSIDLLANADTELTIDIHAGT